jgi:hypothetical protein
MYVWCMYVGIEGMREEIIDTWKYIFETVLFGVCSIKREFIPFPEVYTSLVDRVGIGFYKAVVWANASRSIHKKHNRQN